MDGGSSELSDDWTFVGLESLRRPVVWSKSSIIYTSHPFRPAVEATHFPSKQPVSVPQPSVIQSAPYNYGSLTLLSLSPCDMWLFAYFPGIGVSGVGCLWRRGEEIDAWTEKEWWHFARGDGPIAADWIGGNRQWITDPSGTAKRLPLRGPHLPFPDPMILLVTQSCRAVFCTYHRQLGGNPSTTSFRIFHCSILHTEVMSEQPKIMGPEYDPLGGVTLPGGCQIASLAAIGMQHGEPTVIIATRTRTVPTWSNSFGSVHTMQAEPAMSDTTSTFEDVLTSEWGIWGQQDNIQLCEVRFAIAYVGDKQQHPLPMMSARPIPPIATKENLLTHLAFVPSHVTTSNFNQGLYLLTASILTDGASHSNTELTCYGLSKSRSEGPSWIIQSLSSRMLDTHTLGFIQRLPAGMHSIDLASGSAHLAIGLVGAASTHVSTTGLAKHRRRQLGNVKILSLPGLEDSPGWSIVPMYSPHGSLVTSVVISAALSPNGTLICTVDDLTITTNIHPVPTYESLSAPDAISAHITFDLYRSIKARHVPTDLIGFLASSPLAKGTMDDALVGLLAMMCPNETEASGIKLRDVLGIGLEVRRAKMTSLDSGANAVVRAVQNICSISAANTLFAGSLQDENQYNLDHIWRLINISDWFVRFLEGLARECVYALDSSENDEDMDTRADDGDLFGSFPPRPAVETSSAAVPPSIRPSEQQESHTLLFHLAHPTLLKDLSQLVGHILRLQRQISTTSASTPRGVIAKDACMDLFDSLGVDLERLQPLLGGLLENSLKADKQSLQRSLITCQPGPQLRDMALTAGRKLALSDAVDRMRLFLKAAALADADPAPASAGRHVEDILTKSALSRGTVSQCTRCGARTQVASQMSTELRGLGSWWTPCICGGDWRCG